MKTLLIMRHAKSSWKNSSLPDHDRPLNNRGEEDAPRVGEALKRLDLTPSLILSSTAERAVKTAELVAQASGHEGVVKRDRNLYHAGVDEFIEVLQTVSDAESVVMVVGHNPGVSELVDYMTDRPEMMTTANVAVIRLSIDSWEDLDFETEGELTHVLRPREL